MSVGALDIAYVAIGAKRALTDSPAGYDAISKFDGELDYVQACIAQAPLLARAWTEYERPFPASSATRWLSGSGTHSADTCNGT